MIQIDLLTTSREQEYSQFLLKNDRVLFNSSLKFRTLLRRITQGKDYYLLALDNNKIVGVLPTFLYENSSYGNILNSLPWYGSNPGITVNPLNTKKKDIKKKLLEGFMNIAKDKNAVLSTLITTVFEEDTDLYKSVLKPDYTDSRVGLVTPLPPVSASIDEDLMKIFHSKTRNIVRKSLKNNLSYSHGNSNDIFNFLLDTHTDNMNAVGAPPKNSDLFKGVLDLFEYNSDYRIYIAEKDGKKIAALLLKYFANTVDYFTPAIKSEYRQYQPLNFLIYNAMIDAAKNNYKYWNWGGTTIPGQEGVYHFKKRWGAEECKYYYLVNSYDNNKCLLELTPSQLLKEYPFFYVLPFDILNKKTAGENI